MLKLDNVNCITWLYGRADYIWSFKKIAIYGLFHQNTNIYQVQNKHKKVKQTY